MLVSLAPVGDEPFAPVALKADGESLQRAAVAMLALGMEPLIGDRGDAYGASAPITTEWIDVGNYHMRWLIFTRDGQLHITSVCFHDVPSPDSAKDGGPVKLMRVACTEQPRGRSQIASDLAKEIGERHEAPAEGTSNEAPQ